MKTDLITTWHSSTATPCKGDYVRFKSDDRILEMDGFEPNEFVRLIDVVSRKRISMPVAYLTLVEAVFATNVQTKTFEVGDIVKVNSFSDKKSYLIYFVTCVDNGEIYVTEHEDVQFRSNSMVVKNVDDVKLVCDVKDRKDK